MIALTTCCDRAYVLGAPLRAASRLKPVGGIVEATPKFLQPVDERSAEAANLWSPGVAVRLPRRIGDWVVVVGECGDRCVEVLIFDEQVVTAIAAGGDDANRSRRGCARCPQSRSGVGGVADSKQVTGGLHHLEVGDAGFGGNPPPSPVFAIAENALGLTSTTAAPRWSDW